MCILIGDIILQNGGTYWVINLVLKHVQFNTLLQTICKSPVMAASHHNVILQYTHDELSTSLGLLIIGLSSRQEALKAEMLP